MTFVGQEPEDTVLRTTRDASTVQLAGTMQNGSSIFGCPQHRIVVVPTPTHLCENDDRHVDDSYIARTALTVPTSLCFSQPFIMQL